MELFYINNNGGLCWGNLKKSDISKIVIHPLSRIEGMIDIENNKMLPKYDI